MSDQTTTIERMHENESSREIRQKLVDTAVEFLNMDRIIMQPDSMKRQFLEKKGLTKEEIEIAFQQSKTQTLSRNQVGIPTHGPVSQNQLAFLPPSAPPIRASFWTRLRDWANMIIFISGMAYGIKYLYKYYLRPFLTGEKPKSEEEIFQEVQKSVMEILQQIESMLEKINRNILEHNQKNLEGEALKRSNSSSIQELKTELNTIKSLLVNKKSFPSAPSSYPSIPEWQKRSQPAIEDLQERGASSDGKMNGEKVLADVKDLEDHKLSADQEAK